MTNMEEKPENPDDRSVDRRTIAKLRSAASAAVMETATEFAAFRNSNAMADDARRDLLERPEIIEDVMLQNVLDILRVPPRKSAKKWSEPDPEEDGELTFGAVKAGLAASRASFMMRLRETPGIRMGTPAVVVALYDQVLASVGAAIDQIQNPLGEAARRVRHAGDKGEGGRKQ